MLNISYSLNEYDVFFCHELGEESSEGSLPICYTRTYYENVKVQGGHL